MKLAELLREDIFDQALELVSRLRKDKAAGRGPNSSKEFTDYLKKKHGDQHAAEVYKAAQKLDATPPPAHA
jgi:hypothetical protein